VPDPSAVTVLCLYHYDPLDRLGQVTPYENTGTLRFYKKDRLATESQGTGHISVVQHGDCLLALLLHENQKINSRLLITDEQRSLLNSLDAGSLQPLAFAPYGYLPPERSRTNLLGFKGERPDPVTGHYLLGNGYRAYNPVLMRFNSPDNWSPFGWGGINAYAAFDGDPVNKNDPSGHISFSMMGKLMSALMKWKRKALLKLERMPDIPLTNVLGYLKGNDIKSLAMTSSKMYRNVNNSRLPMKKILGNTEPGTVDQAQRLSDISFGKKQGYLPAQVIGDRRYAAIAKGQELPDGELRDFRIHLERIRKEASRTRRKKKYGEDAASDTSVDSD
jgi:RHS repeat-associated protein